MRLIPENESRKIDTLGRITLPKGLRNRFNLDVGAELELFTANIDGRMCICMASPQNEDDIETRAVEAIDFLTAHGFKVEGRLL